MSNSNGPDKKTTDRHEAEDGDDNHEVWEINDPSPDGPDQSDESPSDDKGNVWRINEEAGESETS